MDTLFPRNALPIFLVLTVAAIPSARASGGYQWENISLGLSTTDLSAIAQVPGDTETLMVGGSGLVFRTDDSGDSWRMVLRIGSGLAGKNDDEDEELDTLEQLIEDRADELYQEAYQRIEDAYGSTYADSIESSLRQEAMESAETEVRQDHAREQNSNTNIEVELRPDDTRIRRIRTFEHLPNEVFVCTVQGLFHSNDGGRRFRVVPLLTGNQQRVIEDVLVLIDSTLIAATEGGLIVRTSGNSPVFSKTPRRNRPARSLLWHEASQRVLAGTDNGILVSSDHGLSFQTLYVPMGAKARHVRDLESPSYASSAIYAATDQGLLLSLSGGASFRHIRPARLGSTPIRRIVHRASPDQMIFATHRGVFLSQNHGQSVQAIHDGLPELDIRDLTMRQRGAQSVLWAATRSGVFRYVKRREIKLARQGWLRMEALAKKDPSLAAALEAATDSAFLDPAVGAELARNLRWRSAGPRLEIRHERIYQRSQTHVSPFDPLLPHIGRTTTVVPGDTETSAFLLFDLRDLIFEPLETTVAEYQERATKRRRRFRERVVRLYHNRIELMLQLLATRKKGTAYIRRIQRFEALTATLDALTDHRLTWIGGNQLLTPPPEL